jgi:hypothetical protein
VLQPGHRDERGIGGIQSVEVALVVAAGRIGGTGTSGVLDAALSFAACGVEDAWLLQNCHVRVE